MKAIILGSTGAVGTELTKALIAMPQIDSVKLLVRRAHTDPAILASSKISQEIVDIFKVENYKRFIQHDLAFSTLGIGETSKTTREEYVKVDFDCVRAFAQACRENGVHHFSSLGAVGANRNSKIFYVKVKGDLEQALRECHFPKLSLFRPSMLMTPTNRYGLTQGILLQVMPLIDPLLIGGLRKYRSITVKDLGTAMAKNVLRQQTGSTEILQWPEFNTLAFS